MCGIRKGKSSTLEHTPGRSTGQSPKPGARPAPSGPSHQSSGRASPLPLPPCRELPSGQEPELQVPMGASPGAFLEPVASDHNQFRLGSAWLLRWHNSHILPTPTAEHTAASGSRRRIHWMGGGGLLRKRPMRMTGDSRALQVTNFA